ncbi:hypothetical protein B7R54_03740 [Subtercola boreus]|uniref:CBM-cenC domain-containing protein n=1 Tax=Subtercola boreus TaxID=120213 RepID=A0A3E0VFW2_9MICO|nr:carbohydrate binding domain-containing protein [Subtercola boreus]RFA08433.1 hypothetical protein B7R54_03740 [Subtercola boreus]TQL54652.1 carbohydrate binding protein [Subtercola boreus]
MSILNRLAASALAVALIVTGLGVVGASTAPAANALSGSSFDAGNIISDATFFNSSSIGQGAVQSFLTSHGSSCRGTAALPCLKDYTQTTPTRAATKYCSTYTGGAGQTAAKIIVDVGVACGINPQVLLVMLQKEQGLVDTSSPTSYMYRSALGYGCPDTAACDSTYYGFFNQVYAASAQFQSYSKNSSSWSYQPGRYNNILYNPNASCGSSPVYIQNQATANLYIYTPYQPNAAALANLGGQGDGCSAYGNRNFWVYFNTWFGDPTSSAGSLKTPSFEGGSVGWEPGNGDVNRVAYNDRSTAEDGSWYYASNTSVVGRSIAQDVAHPVQTGDQVTATMWFRSASGASFSGSLNLWGTGGSTEGKGTAFTVGSTWTPVTVKLPIRSSAHSTVRLEIYMLQTDGTLFMDNASLSFGAAPPLKNLVSTPGFEGGLGAWAPGNGFVNAVAYSDGATARSGTWYGATNTPVAGRSLAQEFAAKPAVGSRYSFSIWVKSAFPSQTFSGRLTLWGLGSGAPVSNGLDFTAGAAWKKVTVTTDISVSGVNRLKPEVYLNTTGNTLFLDDGSVSANILTAGSFEGGSFDKWTTGNGQINQAVYSSAATGIPAKNGSYFAATNTGTAGSSLAQTVQRELIVGDSYSAEVWVRSADPNATFTGTLALWALGGSTEVASKDFTVGAKWTKVAVGLPLKADGHTSLKFEIYERTTGTTLFVDGAQVF